MGDWSFHYVYGTTGCWTKSEFVGKIWDLCDKWDIRTCERAVQRKFLRPTVRRVRKPTSPTSPASCHRRSFVCKMAETRTPVCHFAMYADCAKLSIMCTNMYSNFFLDVERTRLESKNLNANWRKKCPRAYAARLTWATFSNEIISLERLFSNDLCDQTTFKPVAGRPLRNWSQIEIPNSSLNETCWPAIVRGSGGRFQNFSANSTGECGEWASRRQEKGDGNSAERSERCGARFATASRFVNGQYS